MPMVPPNALNRVLTWSDFPHVNRDPPPPGVNATAARTSVHLSDSGYSPTRDQKSGRFKLTIEPTVQVTFPHQSWVANYVFQWPQAEQDALLDHEQIHYMIAALCARDELNELRAISQRDYATFNALKADISTAQGLGSNQAIQDKYDGDTKSLPTQNVAQQTKWATSVRGALQSNQPLRDSLRQAGLI